ncbi:Protein of unknown function [Devosia crocina]|uniref:DUF2937 family protein n=1 Tax=Devosia crocina TaxID=429728 RepID=A0A1I7NUI0_9HYPH|nr:DUF2937 family protein [Devosia crocina]SFV38282.1 Protein of unknown function [Devosia crocina]
MRRILASVGGVGMALILSQFPEYAQQYTQRLGGAVDELRIATEEFDRAAAEGGLSRQEALDRFNASNDDFLAGRGTSMTATFQRYDRLSQTLARIRGAGPVERLQSLPAYLDSDIGQRTLENYQPAVPFTLEGILYAAAGFLVGFAILSALVKVCAMPFRRRRPVYRRS